jgi:hypothetical protein
MTNQITINVNIAEIVGHLGVVTVDEADLKAWMAEFGYTELTLQNLSEHIADSNLEMAEKYTDIKDSTWSQLAFEDPTVTDIPIGAEPVDPPEDEARYYWDTPADGDNDTNEPYGAQTVRIIDQEAGGVIAYVHRDTAPDMVATLNAANAAKAAL